MVPRTARRPEAPPPAGSRVRAPPGSIRCRLRPCGRSGLQHGRRARASAQVRDHGGAAHPLAPLQCLPLASPHRLPPSSAPSCSSACRMHSRREVMYFCIPSLLRRENASRDAWSVGGGTEQAQWRARGKKAFASRCWPQSKMRSCAVPLHKLLCTCPPPGTTSVYGWMQFHP